MLAPQQALWLELMPFSIREAWPLDERKLKEWLDLFTDDVLYFMPRRKNVPCGEGSPPPLRLPRGFAAQGERRVEGGQAHDRARRQRPARQKPQRLPLDQPS
jgi:3-phenylpropionate/cinnamic acid dioxygenase small subunit